MNRKSFLSGLVSAAAVFLPGLPAVKATGGRAVSIPPYLRAGDTIGITSPAGYISREEIRPAILRLESWGFRTRIGETIGRKEHGFGGTDEERLADLQQMLDDPSLRAILCARGGYGAIRIIDGLDFSAFSKDPKWIIGFSDITVLHSHLSQNLGIASLHSKMCNSFPPSWEKAAPMQVDTILSIQRALTGEKTRYDIRPDLMNRSGQGEGLLVGGNLKTLETLSGTRSDIDTAGKILFVEDTGEFLYSIDRMFWHLKRTGKLAMLEGLVIGGFRIKTDVVGEEFGRSLYDIVLEKVSGYTYPVCFNFPVGHQVNNYALKCGVMHRLEVNAVSTSLREV